MADHDGSDIEYQRAPAHCLATIGQPPVRSDTMNRPVLAATLALAFASPAAAECYADFKVKRDDPLTLRYGVSQVSDVNCSPDAAAGELAPRLAGDGWTLLNVLSTFGPEGLEERKASAGEFFLRY
jgi:uncharacterized membrane protein